MCRLSIIGLLFVSLAFGACEFFSDGPDASDSRDGFLIEAGPILFVSDEGGRYRQLYSMQPDGSDIRQLTRSSSRYGISDAVWSPDGQKILIREYGPVVERNGDNDAFYVTPKVMKVVDTKGDELSRCRFDEIRMISDLVWAPDSKLYVMGSSRVPRRNYLVDSQTCDVSQFRESPTSISDIYRREGEFISDWSRGGHTLLGTVDYSDYDSASDVFTRNFPVTFWTAIGDSVFSFGEVGVEHINPIWSHSEEQIAVGRYSEEGWFLYRVSADGSTRIRLTGVEYTRVFPDSWSPDDSQILMRARHIDSFTTRILLVDADGGGITDITPFPGEVNLPTSWRSN